MGRVAYFWATAQLHNAERGYYRMSIPAHVSEELRLYPRMRMKVIIEVTDDGR